ncbi:hypothetical protein Leryth_012445 [Lithospermum erythrorhizon]|nr:hypothetical protein Leryth_012445 [Lithospermum erythrorhizon]
MVLFYIIDLLDSSRYPPETLLFIYVRRECVHILPSLRYLNFYWDPGESILVYNIDFLDDFLGRAVEVMTLQPSGYI